MTVEFHADDFGLCPEVNRAVERAHCAGRLTSASLMANMPAFDEAVAIAQRNPHLALSIHLNCLRGAPLLSPTAVPSLVNGHGEFLDHGKKFAWRALRGRIAWDECAAEFAAQIERILATGLTPTTLDTEKHLHLCFAPLARIVTRLALQYQIPMVRTIHATPQTAPVCAAMRTTNIKQRFLAWRSHGVRRLLRAHRVASAAYHCCITNDTLGRLTQAALPIIVHPAEPIHDGPWARRRFYRSRNRQWELELVTKKGHA